jgi:hypothetical protein
MLFIDRGCHGILARCTHAGGTIHLGTDRFQYAAATLQSLTTVCSAAVTTAAGGGTSDKEAYDFDLFALGGGTAGVRAARLSASMGKPPSREQSIHHCLCIRMMMITVCREPGVTHKTCLSVSDLSLPPVGGLHVMSYISAPQSDHELHSTLQCTWISKHGSLCIRDGIEK